MYSSPRGASAPAWVAAEAGGPGDEPLALTGVVFDPGAEEALAAAWRAAPRASLYPDVLSFLALVREALGRDIRSVTQRLQVPGRHAHGGSAALDLNPSSGQPAGSGSGFWRVVLDGVEVAYDIVEPYERGAKPVVVVRGGKACVKR